MPLGAGPLHAAKKGATGGASAGPPVAPNDSPTGAEREGRRAGRGVPPGVADVYQSIRTPTRIVNGARMALGFW